MLEENLYLMVQPRPYPLGGKQFGVCDCKAFFNMLDNFRSNLIPMLCQQRLHHLCDQDTAQRLERFNCARKIGTDMADVGTDVSEALSRCTTNLSDLGFHGNDAEVWAECYAFGQ